MGVMLIMVMVLVVAGDAGGDTALAKGAIALVALAAIAGRAHTPSAAYGSSTTRWTT